MENLTIEEFKKIGGTDSVTSILFELSKDKINNLTFNRITDIGFHNLTIFQKNIIIKSMNYLIKYYIDNPEEIEGNQNLTSYSVGDISVTVDHENTSDKILKIYGIPSNAYNLLKQTGLMRKGF